MKEIDNLKKENEDYKNNSYFITPDKKENRKMSEELLKLKALNK